MDEKIIELETKFSFQEELLRELNESVINQQRQLEEMRHDIVRLQNQLSEVVDAQSAQISQTANDEKPPHY